KGNPIYSAFKRVVLEVARNRTKPNLVPGIEAMLPESPMARLHARAPVQDGMKLAIISGDIEGGGWLKRLGVLFTDFTFFDSSDNDLVVDTDSMSAGIARPQAASVLFDKGPEVHHFRYFVNEATRSALRSWLLEASVDQLESFKPLRGVDERVITDTRVPARGAAAGARPRAQHGWACRALADPQAPCAVGRADGARRCAPRDARHAEPGFAFDARDARRQVEHGAPARCARPRAWPAGCDRHHRGLPRRAAASAQARLRRHRQRAQH